MDLSITLSESKVNRNSVSLFYSEPLPLYQINTPHIIEDQNGKFYLSFCGCKGSGN